MSQVTITTEQVHELIEQLAAMTVAASITPEIVANIFEKMRNLNDQEREKVIAVAEAYIEEIHNTGVDSKNVIYRNQNSVEVELDILSKIKKRLLTENVENNLYFTDAYGNITVQIDANGLTATDVKVKQNNALVSILSLLANKVDKVTGKGLSTEDFTTALKNSLLSLSDLSPLAHILEELSESLNPSLAGGFYVTDNNRNIIAKLSADGLETTKVRAAQYVDENGESIIPEPTPTPSGGTDGIYTDYLECLYICDANGYVAAKYSANGLEVIEVKAKKYKDANGEEITGGDNRFVGWEMFTIGDSLCRTGQWQPTTANILGCTFDQSKNQKPGANLSVGGTQSFGIGFDTTPWRVKNLIEQQYIQGNGSKALIIFENINDGVQSFDKTAQPFKLQEPIEGHAYSSFNSSLLATIPSNKRLLDTCFRLTTINQGKNLAITQLPTVEGDVKISVGWSGPGVQDYYIHVEPKATDEETLQDIIEKILEYNYTGVTDTLADDEESVNFSTGTAYAVTLTFTDTGNTGMRVSVTDTNNAKGSRAKYFIGDSPKILTLSGSNIGSGSFKLNIDWGKKGSATVLTIPVTAQTTDQETITSIISAVCSQTVTGVSISAGANNSIIFQKTETTHSSLTLSLSNVEVSGLSYTIDTGDVLDTIWENTSYWQDGMTYSEGWITAIAMLQQAYPDCKIAIASFPALNVTQSEYLLPNGMYDVATYYKKYLSTQMVNRLQQYKDIAECMTIPMLDVHDNCGISISNFTQFYNLSKNVHPKQAGYVRWGETIAALIKSNF